ncbi:MAG: Gldg family protein [Bacteroidota bacterium]
MKLTKATVSTRILLYVGIFIVLNLLAYQLFFRLDFTADQRYTLSQSTKDILKDLAQPVTVVAYFSDDLPPQLDEVKTGFQDMLSEYETYSDGRVVYEFITPDEEEKVRLQQSGIPQIQIQSREADKANVQLSYMAAEIKVGTGQEILPRITSQQGLEYGLSTSIKKLATTNKARIGLIVGHGEPGLAQMTQARQLLSIQYQVDTVKLDDPAAWGQYKTLAMLAPSQPIAPQHLASLDAFLKGGGSLFVGLNAVNGDLQAQGFQPWDKVNTGLESWLMEKGIVVEQSFLVDAQSIQITTQRQQQTPFGVMTVQQPIAFPFFPIVTGFEAHPISEGLEQMILMFASPILIAEPDSGVEAGVLLKSSPQSGKLPAPTFFTGEREWTQQDFASGEQNLAVWLKGDFGNGNEGRMVVVSDGDFPVDQGQQGTLPDNLNFFVNAIDWLTDDTGLIELRTKGVTARPIGEVEDGTRNFLKGLNMLLPLLIVIIYGFIRFQRRKVQRLKWEAQDYS